MKYVGAIILLVLLGVIGGCDECDMSDCYVTEGIVEKASFSGGGGCNGNSYIDITFKDGRVGHFEPAWRVAVIGKNCPIKITHYLSGWIVRAEAPKCGRDI